MFVVGKEDFRTMCMVLRVLSQCWFTLALNAWNVFVSYKPCMHWCTCVCFVRHGLSLGLGLLALHITQSTNHQHWRKVFEWKLSWLQMRKVKDLSWFALKTFDYFTCCDFRWNFVLGMQKKNTIQDRSKARDHCSARQSQTTI